MHGTLPASDLERWADSSEPFSLPVKEALIKATKHPMPSLIFVDETPVSRFCAPTPHASPYKRIQIDSSMYL
jgi:hypothetical protein